MDTPQTRYAKNGETHLAYQVLGEGPIDLVFVLGWITNLDAMWEYPPLARMLRGLASFSRLILFDKRGVGLSDRSMAVATLEERMDDVRAVMDAAGSERAALMGISEGAPMSILFAATYPERARALVIVGGYASRLKSAETPNGPTREDFIARVDALAEKWGTPVMVEEFAPSMQRNAEFLAWWRRYLQQGGSPGVVRALGRFYPDIDVRAALPAIQTPTLVMHPRGDRVIPFEFGEYIARNIPNARLLPLETEDHLPWVGDVDRFIAEVQEFLTGARPEPQFDRVLATVLCTDIVDSTARAAELGDAAWRRMVERHDAIARREVAESRGRLIKTLGDGVLATFDGPARAIRCAASMREQLRPLGLPLRAGLHTGEIETRPDDIAGLAVNISARVAAMGQAGEILVSRTVRDLVVGSDIGFEDRGEFTLKGVPGAWGVHAVASC